MSLCALHHQSPSPGDLSRAIGSPAKVFLWRILQRYTRFVARSRPLVCLREGQHQRILLILAESKIPVRILLYSVI